MDNLNEGEKKGCCGGHGEHDMGMGMMHHGMGRHGCVKKIIGLLALALTIFVGLKAYNTYLESKYIGADQIAQNNITVSATGEAFAKPDVAQIYISVTEKAKTAAEAQTAHTAKINKVVDYLKSAGIEDKDIKTTGYNISEDYNYTQMGGRIFLGYVVNQSLEVKVRKMDNAGSVLSGAVAQGATEIGGISFVIDNEDAVKRDARKKAIDDAKTKAEQIAKDLGVKLVRIVSFNESGDQPIYARYDMMKSEAVGGAAAPAPQIPTGENKITVSVSITYEIR